ncbi:hypothetical protein D9M71_660030 [compost metagenome]
MLEVVAQYRFDQRCGMGAQTEQAKIGKKSLPVEPLGLANGFATQADQGEQVLGKGIRRTISVTGAVAIFAPDWQ